jgi:hypothetical protein
MNFRKISRKRNLQVRPEPDQQDFVIDEVMYNEDREETTFTLEPHDAGQPERHQSEGYDRSVERDAIMRSGLWTLRDNYKSMYGL